LGAVDPYDAGSKGRCHSLDVVRHHRGGEAEPRVVREPHRLGLVAERAQANDRAEDLLSPDLAVQRRVGYDKLVTVGARTSFEGDIATFTRYLFASGPLLTGQRESHPLIVKGRPISSVFDIDGSQEIASNRRGWVRVPNPVLRSIADYQNQVAPTNPKGPKPKFCPGDEAIIIDGPFMAFQATIVEAIGVHNAKVMIRSFGKEIAATMSVSALRVA
jgi:hypothetical protein